MKSYKALILDMDGVLWRGPEWLIDPAPAFGRLRAAGIRVALATNNATRPAAHYLERFASAGFTLEPWQIVTSATATASHLASALPDRGEVFVVGESGLEEALTEQGFTLGSRNPIAVVCGLDRSATYDKLKTASLAIRGGALFIGTNPDLTLPIPEGEAPGAGALLAALTAASGQEPTVIGKPGPIMFRQALEKLRVGVQDVLVVGDRLETDIAGGQALGSDTACVLSGVSTRETAGSWRPPPTWVFEDLNTLIDSLVHQNSD